MSEEKDIHVVPRSHGWAPIKEGASRAGSIHRTKKDAQAAARSQAIRERVEVVTHGKDGEIRDSDSYGNDPLPRDRRH